MQARSSAHIPAAWAGSPPGALPIPGHPQLLDRLATVVRANGRRHTLSFARAPAVCAVLAGAKSHPVIAGCAADAPAAVLTTLGGPSREPGRPTAPTEATVRRALQQVDGKIVCGARRTDGSQIHPLTAMTVIGLGSSPA